MFPMTNLPRALVLGALLLSPCLRAVYAPIPEQEQGKALTVNLKTGLSFDSNIFGAAERETDSMISSGTAKAAFNASLTDQTFGSFSYQATLDHYYDRPGSKNLDSHEAMARVAHAFSPATTLDVFDFFQLQRNPESLLAGLPLNTNQSFARNQIDANFTSSITAKDSFSLKCRSVLYDFEDPALGTSLDRTENLYGLAATYGLLPEIKLVVEARHQDIAYRHEAGDKDKHSNYALVGADYKASEKMTLTGRAGVERRKRDGERSTSSPSIEVSAKYDYSERSFVSAGYAYTLEEASNIALFTDTEVNRLFLNFQHQLSPVLVGSVSLTYEPSVLQGRNGVGNIDENTARAGFGLSYMPTKNWTFSLTFDLDRVRSDDPMREMDRRRFGLQVSFVF